MLDVVYQDAHLIAINKPPGLLSVPGLASPDNALDRALKDYPNSRTVHRLDMSTSGLLLLAQSYNAQKAFNKLFSSRAIRKRYIALVANWPEADQGDIQLPLCCDWPNRPKQKVDWALGKPAHTQFQVIERLSEPQQTRVELFPVTGRSHQLRVHMLALGHPIIGDALYHPEYLDRQDARLMLHAQDLWFDHPMTGETLHLHCPPSF